MISYGFAYEKAKTLKNNINACTEYEQGYVFYNTNDQDYDGGAGHTPVIILKENGEAVNYLYNIVNGLGEEVKNIEIK